MHGVSTVKRSQGLQIVRQLDVNELRTAVVQLSRFPDVITRNHKGLDIFCGNGTCIMNAVLDCSAIWMVTARICSEFSCLAWMCQVCEAPPRLSKQETMNTCHRGTVCALCIKSCSRRHIFVQIQEKGIVFRRVCTRASPPLDRG